MSASSSEPEKSYFAVLCASNVRPIAAVNAAVRIRIASDYHGYTRAMPDTHPLERIVAEELAALPILDIHTHLFAPHFGGIGLWGIDELLTYHYLEAEVFRFGKMRPAEYWSLNKSQQADQIWKTLFVENDPLSEATRGCVAVLQALGLDTRASSLAPLRGFFKEQKIETYYKQVFKLAGIESCVMTNDPLDPAEAAVWNQGFPPATCFHA